MSLLTLSSEVGRHDAGRRSARSKAVALLHDTLCIVQVSAFQWCTIHHSAGQ